MRQLFLFKEGDPFSRNRLVRGGVWALIGKLITTIAAIGVIATLARLLSVNELGSYFLLLNFAELLRLLRPRSLRYDINYGGKSSIYVHPLTRPKSR